MSSEWDDTPWAGSTVESSTKAVNRGMTLYEPPTVKAVTDITPWARGVPLSTLLETPQQKAAAYLRAYKCGWFYKAESKISGDISTLDWSVSNGDAEEGDQEATLDRPKLSIPFASLSPVDQFQRLLERPNPYQTGRALLQKTAIRIDMAGTAFWYLEGGELPTAIYGISPARMWPSYDKKNQLLGWVLDYDARGGGMPLDVSEVLPFTTVSADTDMGFDWGIGVVEAVFAELPLTELMARHTADLLQTGGRLAGMMWPRDRVLGADEFEDAQRAWRSVATDPNAARRLLIFPEAMEYATGASTPKEIGIPELATLNRDTILTAFPISPYRLGVPTPGGLNSGMVRTEDRLDYWTETIHPRADLIEETIQTGLLSRYEQFMGTPFDFEIAEPNTDDAPTLLEKSGAFKALVSIGFDPKETVKAVGLSHIKWIGLPPTLDPTAPPPVPVGPGQPGPQGQLTATAHDQSHDTTRVEQPLSKAIKAREDVAAQQIPEVAKFFAEQRDRIAERVTESLPQTKAARMKADPTWWDAQAEDDELKTTLGRLYAVAGRASLQVVADTMERIVTSKAVRRIIDDLNAYGGERITGINERTREAVAAQIAEGTRRGYSIPQLVNGVPEEGYPGVRAATLDAGVDAFSDYRAEMVARTETALSYNRAAITSYDTFGVKNVQAIDGDQDEACADRNGREFSVEEAYAIEDHPNGTLDWVPILDKSVHREDLLAAINAISQPVVQHFYSGEGGVKALELAQPTEPLDLTPVIDEIKVLSAVVQALPAPVVNVPAPIVKVTRAPVTDVRVTSMPERIHRIVRDKTGKPTHSIEDNT